MQNPIQKFRQSSIVFEKPGTPTTPQFNIFCWKFPHVSYLPMSTKVYAGFFFFVYILSFLQKLKEPGFYTLVFFTFLLITQDLDKIKKSWTPSFRQKKPWFLGNNIPLS